MGGSCLPNALQIDESALTGEERARWRGTRPPCMGGRSNRASRRIWPSCRTPVTHGNGVMVVTGRGSSTEVGKIVDTPSRQRPMQGDAAHEADEHSDAVDRGRRRTHDIVMFVLGLQPWSVMDRPAPRHGNCAGHRGDTARSADGRPGRARIGQRRAGQREGDSQGSALGRDARVHLLRSTQTRLGRWTMNQMTAVEVVDPTDRYVSTRRHRVQPRGEGHPPGRQVRQHRGRNSPLRHRQRHDARGRQGRGRSNGGRSARAGPQGRVAIHEPREQLPRLATLPFDPTYKLMATFNQAKDVSGKPGRALLRQGRGACGDGARRPPPRPTAPASPGTTRSSRAPSRMRCMGEAGLRVMAGAFRDLDAASFDPSGDFLACRRLGDTTSLVGMVRPAPRRVQGRCRRGAGGAYRGADGDR